MPQAMDVRARAGVRATGTLKGLGTPGLDAEGTASRVRAFSTKACVAGRMFDPLSPPQALVVTEQKATTAGGG
jgi:hypothetical protein